MKRATKWLIEGKLTEVDHEEAKEEDEFVELPLAETITVVRAAP